MNAEKVSARSTIDFYLSGGLSQQDAAAWLVWTIKSQQDVRPTLDMIPPELWKPFVAAVANLGDGTDVVVVDMPNDPIDVEVLDEIRRQLRERGVSDSALRGVENGERTDE